MALRSHEYVECQEERKRPLILSEVRADFILTLTSWDCLLTGFGKSSPELIRIAASAHVSPSTPGISGIALLQFIRSLLSYASRESETNQAFIVGFDDVR